MQSDDAAELGVSDELRALVTDSRTAIEQDRQQKEELVQLRRQVAELTRQRLEKQAQERQQLRRDGKAGGLLDAVELAEAEAWVQSDDAAELGVSDDLRALVTDSRTAIEQEQRSIGSRRPQVTAGSHRPAGSSSLRSATVSLARPEALSGVQLARLAEALEDGLTLERLRQMLPGLAEG